MATRKVQAGSGALDAPVQSLNPRKLNTRTGQISEYVDGEWRDTGLVQDVQVGESKLASLGAGAAQVASAPARLFQSAAGVTPAVQPDPELYAAHYGQNPLSMMAGQFLGGLPSMVAGAGLGAGAGLAANIGIQGAIGALSNAEDPLSNALWAAAMVGGVGLLPGVRGAAARMRGRGGVAADVAPVEAAQYPGVGKFAHRQQTQQTQQPQGQYYGGRAPPGTQPGLGGGVPGESGLLSAADNPAMGADVGGELTQIPNRSARAGMDEVQLAEARRLGMYVDPASELGSDTLARFQQRGVMNDAMDIGRRQNQKLLTESAGRAAGIEGRNVNAFTLEDAMRRTRNGFTDVAGETKAVPKHQVMDSINEVLSDPIAHGPLIRRFDRAPESMDGRQLGAMQSYLAKERFKYAKQGDLNMVDAFDAAHQTILDTIERGLPAGSRGNYARLREQYQAQMVLERPGVMGAGDTINATSFYSKLRREGRASPELRRARRIAQLMHTMRDTLPLTGVRGGPSPLATGAGAGAGAALFGPIGGILGAGAGMAANRLAPAGLFAAYNRGAPAVMGLLGRVGL